MILPDQKPQQFTVRRTRRVTGDRVFLAIGLLAVFALAGCPDGKVPDNTVNNSVLSLSPEMRNLRAARLNLLERESNLHVMTILAQLSESISTFKRSDDAVLTRLRYGPLEHFSAAQVRDILARTDALVLPDIGEQREPLIPDIRMLKTSGRGGLFIKLANIFSVTLDRVGYQFAYGDFNRGCLEFRNLIRWLNQLDPNSDAGTRAFVNSSWAMILHRILEGEDGDKRWRAAARSLDLKVSGLELNLSGIWAGELANVLLTHEISGEDGPEAKSEILEIENTLRLTPKSVIAISDEPRLLKVWKSYLNALDYELEPGVEREMALGEFFAGAIMRGTVKLASMNYLWEQIKKEPLRYDPDGRPIMCDYISATYMKDGLSIRYQRNDLAVLCQLPTNEPWLSVYYD